MGNDQEIITKRTLEPEPFHEFDPEELERLRSRWTVWRRAEQRPFDPEACGKLALECHTNREGGWMAYVQIHRIVESFREVDGLLTREEAAFWFSLLTSTEYMNNPGNALEVEQIVELGSQLTPDTPAEELFARVKTDPRFLTATHSSILQHLRPLRELVSYEELLEFLGAEVKPELAGMWLWILGPPPEASREAAMRWAEAGLAGVDFFSLMWREMDAMPRLLDRIPWIPGIEALFDVWAKRKRRCWDSVIFGLLYRLDDPGRIAHYLKSIRFNTTPDEVKRFYANMGSEHFDLLFRHVVRRGRQHHLTNFFSEALKIHHPAIVVELHRYAEHPEMGRRVEAWLLNEGANAVEGLLQLCHRRGMKRDWALKVLRQISEKGPKDRELIERLLESHPPKARELVRKKVLEFEEEQVETIPEAEWIDWMKALAERADADDSDTKVRIVRQAEIEQGASPKKEKRLVFSLQGLPPLTVAGDGRALPPAIVEGLLIACARLHFRRTPADITHYERREEDLRAAVEAIDPEAAEVFAMALFDAWKLSHFSTGGLWVLEVMAQFGQRAIVAELGRFVRASRSWSTTTQVSWALTTLGLIDLPEARFILNEHATRLQNESLRRTAHQIVGDLRAKHHWSADEFDDVSVPTLGLDEKGCSFFDYGPRTIKMVVHGREELLLIDQSTGKQYEKLPPARKKDDREKYAFARQEYKFIRKPLLEVVSSQSRRFERAMLTGHRWSVPHWKKYVLGHPILGHMARRLVWKLIAEDSEEAQFFRPDEEGACVDVDFDDVELPEGGQIALAHPAELDAELRSGWEEHLVDSEIIQPIDQLGRVVHELDEQNLDLIEKLKNQKVLLQPKQRMEVFDLGWEHKGNTYYSHNQMVFKRQGESQKVVVTLSRGISISRKKKVNPYQWQQGIVSIDGFEGDQEIPLEELSPVLVSEAITLLHDWLIPT